MAPPPRRRAGKPERRPAKAAEPPEVEADESPGTDADAEADPAPEAEVDVAPEAEVEVDRDAELDEDADDVEVDEADGEGGRSAATEEFWAGVRVDPVEIALPGGVGYTLRAYRLDTEITPADVSTRQDDVTMPSRSGPYDDLEDEDVDDDDLDDDDTEDADDADADDADADEDDEEEAAAPEAEEVPIFLSQQGRLLVFRSAEGLVAFVRSDAEHDLSQLDTWAEVTEGISAARVAPDPEDEYELDLVVNNLRGGHDAWDPDLVVRAGQLARDVGHALHIEPVVHSLAPGSPLDNLDEVLRAQSEGGFGAFMARRKAKRIGAETASLGWRSVIGKISSVVDWRD